ncbi:MAG: hypothetical protein F9K13_04190 [Candidatus Methylomirabilis oxygeniifera]|uniref:Histone H1 n=1 Tax=Methylomirabilis oxygeniifera TaxID=671143 RepID=D5MM20_METO1|nr:MAG: hypothetical protein F9K13_04190 [Candidatus Methylomirabilis oxyfera]CBE67906.1 conserved exported protein of unknown function [Candidatus Methylomirabilis oxyfera]
MPKRTSKKLPTDINVLASSIVQAATGEKPASESIPQKNPAAVALGRLGGLKGGPARAKKLSAKARSRIAKKAALTRWASEAI